MASVTATLRRTDDRLLGRAPVSTPAALGFVNAAVVIASIVAAVHGVGSTSPAAGSPGAAGPVVTVDGQGDAFGATLEPAGGAAAGKILVWAKPEDVAASFVRAAAKGDCSTLSAATGKTAAVRARLNPTDFCKRERLVFHGFSVLEATRTGGSGTSATIDVRVHGVFGTSDLNIRTGRAGKAWTVSSIS